MTEEQIKFLLSDDNNEVLEAHKEIVAMQKDKSNILLFGDKWLDDNLIGGLNNKLCFFGSRPSNGKTFHCSQTINNLLNTELNPTPVSIMRFNLEMPTQSLMLQEISKVLKRDLKDILSRPYSEEEKPTVGKVVKSFMDKRVKNISKVLGANDFKQLVLTHIQEVDEKDRELNTTRWYKYKADNLEMEEEELISSFRPIKTKKIGLIDHLMVYKNKDEIDSILLVCNELKMLDSNLSFVIYFQFRRDIEDMWRDSKDKKVNPKNMLPNSTFIYQTDILQQVADIVVGFVIPQIYDLDEFAAVHKERNIHLKEHFSDDKEDNSYVRLKGRNRIYYNFLKIRLLNSFDDPRLFCSVLNPEYEEKASKIMEENKNPFKGSIQTPLFSTPTFEKPSPVKPNFSMENAFDIPETDSPF